MTQKDYVRAYLDFLKIVMGGFIGAMFVIAIYNLQTSGIFMIASISIIFLLIVFVFLSIRYFTLMNELKELH